MSPHFLRKYIFALITLLACQSVEATKRNHDESFQGSGDEQPVKKLNLDLEESDDYESSEYPVSMNTPLDFNLLTPTDFMALLGDYKEDCPLV